LLVAPGV